MFRTRASLATLLMAAVLAGCSTGGSSGGEAGAPAAAASNDGRCNADGAAFAVGKPGTPALLEQARTASGAQIARILTPRDVVTLEYRSDRLNLNVTEQGQVNRVNCG